MHKKKHAHAKKPEASTFTKNKKKPEASKFTKNSKKAGVKQLLFEPKNVGSRAYHREYRLALNRKETHEQARASARRASAEAISKMAAT